MANALIALAVAALLCASSLAETDDGRKGGKQTGNSNQQQNKQPARAGARSAAHSSFTGLLTCGDAQKIGKSKTDNLCCPLCYCLGKQSANEAFLKPAIQRLCKEKCSNCVVAAGKCASTQGDLPKECSEGLAFSPAVKVLLDKCAALYVNDPGMAKRVQSC